MKEWDSFLEQQEKSLGKEVVSKWLRSLKVLHFDACNLYLEADNAFQTSWFEEHLRPLVNAQLFNNNHHPIKVHLTNSQEKKNLKTKKKSLPSSFDPPLFKIDSDPLSEKATFENYIPGEKNGIAYQFLLDIKLGAFNPIFLYGPKSVGKTHLLMACAKKLQSQGIAAFYVHAETFTEHVVKAIRNSQMQEFRKIYRNQSVLIIDDVDQLSRKIATQEELFHTFNTFHTQGRQIILSSSLPPSRLVEIEPRLISRFEWGIIFHLENLSFEELKKAVHIQLDKRNIPIKEEEVEFIITMFPKNMKTLFSALDLLYEDYLGNPIPLTKERIEKILFDLIEIELEVKLTPEKIVGKIAEYFGIKGSDILGKSQAHEFTLPRQIAMEICRTKLKMPYLRIGHHFSRDHSTVISSIKQIKIKRCDPDTNLDRMLKEIDLML